MECRVGRTSQSTISTNLALTKLLSLRNLSIQLLSSRISLTHVLSSRQLSLMRPISLLVRLIMNRLSKNGEAYSAKYKHSDMLHRQVDTQQQLEYTSFEQKELVIQRIKDLACYIHIKCTRASPCFTNSTGASPCMLLLLHKFHKCLIAAPQTPQGQALACYIHNKCTRASPCFNDIMH